MVVWEAFFVLLARNFFPFDDFLIDKNLRDVLGIQGEALASLFSSYL